MSKSSLGQFYTTNYDYILQNMYIPSNISHIIEPFAGQGDLLAFIKDKHLYQLECYDIDPKAEYIKQRDTLTYPPNYSNQFVLTNPPYLARNKSECKHLYDKYDVNDLYKCFLCSLLENELCEGGIVIIPLNFFSSIRKADVQLREKFMNRFHIQTLNIFEETVFQDTTYTICSFQFCKYDNETNTNHTNICIYPSNTEFTYHFSEANHYTIGGELYDLPLSTNYKIERATRKTTQIQCTTNINVKCIDDSVSNRIQWYIVDKDEDRYIDTTVNLTARSYMTLVIEPSITIEKQKELVEKCNTFLETQRKKYNSLFLTNYRESNTIARKRISFDFIFRIVSYMLDQ